MAAVEELRRERGASSLILPELTDFVFGKDLSAKRKKLFRYVAEDPIFTREDAHFLSSDNELCERSVEQSIHYIKVVDELGLDANETRIIFDSLPGYPMLAAHTVMFLPTIEGQGDVEQQAKWLPLARGYKIIGSYSQTELGHGTNVQGLETTATYDPKREEFVINTPTLTSTKWWPGALGIASTHTIVVARLISKGVDHGVHHFIVPIRSLEDHTPLPGIEVGDIGPKFGLTHTDNGYLRLDNVHIPRDHMLMKYSKVTPDGTYTKSPVSKAAYGTMVQFRSNIVFDSGNSLAKAITIAIRYSVVRRQGESANGGPETQVLDYQTQQYKLLPLIATAYGILISGRYMSNMYNQIQSEIQRGNFNSLQELHVTAAGLKAFSTQVCVDGIESCRLACGGHGYSLGSGLPSLYVKTAPAITYEGENTVLYLQAARYLHKLYSKKLPSSKLSANVSHLSSDFVPLRKCHVTTAQQYMDPHIVLEAYRQRARRMIVIAATRYQEYEGRGLTHSDAWNMSTCDWITAATAHYHYVVMKIFNNEVHSGSLSGSNLVIMESLCAMFATIGIIKYSGEFMTDGFMSSDQVELARQQLYSLLITVRKEAVPLVDAFDFPDELLNSALGRYDGDVYTHLYQWAQKAPRNKEKVHNTYEKHLKGLLKHPQAKL